jgi:hypothetical protein
MFLCIYDFTKAFGYLVRYIIWFTLIRYGVRGKMLDVMQASHCPEIDTRWAYEYEIFNFVRR